MEFFNKPFVYVEVNLKFLLITLFLVCFVYGEFRLYRQGYKNGWKSCVTAVLQMMNEESASESNQSSMSEMFRSGLRMSPNPNTVRSWSMGTLS